jgi:hypothetical protein
MQINKKYFPKVMQDNEMIYFAHLEGIIDSIDELSTLEIVRNPRSYHFRYTEPLLQELLKFHNMFKIRLELSKSIKSSSTIVFEINLEDS